MRGAGEPAFECDFPPGSDMMGEIRAAQRLEIGWSLSCSVAWLWTDIIESCLCFLCLADNVRRVCGSFPFCPISLVLVLLSFISFPLLFCALFLSSGRGDEDAADEPIGTADRKRINSAPP